jgi:sulfite exporter TauE/SafE
MPLGSALQGRLAGLTLPRGICGSGLVSGLVCAESASGEIVLSFFSLRTTRPLLVVGIIEKATREWVAFGF